jgi:hypothetical protein
MHLIDTDGAVGNRFVPGNPAIGQQATVVDDHILNAFMLEIANAVTAAGITLVKDTNTQLRDAIAKPVHGTDSILTPGTGCSVITGDERFRVFLDRSNVVHLDGMVEATASSTSIRICNSIPSQFRPPTTNAVLRAVYSTNAGTIHTLSIAPTGEVDVFPVISGHSYTFLLNATWALDAPSNP